MREVSLESCLAACRLQGILMRGRGCYVRIVVSFIFKGLLVLIHRPRRRSCGESNVFGP